jgi:hypothetical protein
LDWKVRRIIAGEATPVDMALGRRKNAKETKC